MNDYSPTGAYSIDFEAWSRPKPFGISGCFRLRNESEFMETAILSHLLYLDEAVLAVQPSEDDTMEKAHRLADENPKIRICEYPFVPDWIDTPGFYSNAPDEPGHWVHLSNWALSQCHFSWIAKTEGDVICLSSFQKVVDRIWANPDERHYYGRVLLNLAGEDCNEISLNHPRNAGWDEAVFPNHPDYHFIRSGKFEALVHNGPRTCLGWSGLHMKRCKSRNVARIRSIEPWAPFDRPNVRMALEAFNAENEYVGVDNPLGEDCLYEREWLDYYFSRRTKGVMSGE